MIVVTFNGNTYECAEAVKGSDFILLYDSNRTLIASFFKITDFSLFSISGGDWTPYAEESITIRSATLSGGVITLTGYSEIGTGTIVKLTAPGNSEDVTQGISIDGEVFPVVSPTLESISGTEGAWVSGAVIALLIDKTNKRAYMMGGGGSIKNHNEDTDAHPWIQSAMVRVRSHVVYNGGGNMISDDEFRAAVQSIQELENQVETMGASVSNMSETVQSYDGDIKLLKEKVTNLDDIVTGDPDENDPYYLDSVSGSQSGEPGIYLSSKNASFTDSTQLIIQVCLQSQPDDTVSLDIKSGGVAVVSPQAMTFTPDNYSAIQYLTLSYSGEALENTATDTVTITAHGGNYEGITKTLPVSILPTGTVTPPDPGGDDDDEPITGDDAEAFANLRDATAADFSASVCLSGINIDGSGVVNGTQSVTYAALMVPAYNGISAIEWKAEGTAGTWICCGRGSGNQWVGFGDTGSGVSYAGDFNNGAVQLKNPITTIVNNSFLGGTGRKYRASRIGNILRVYEHTGSAWELRLHLDISAAAALTASYYEQNTIGVLYGSSYHKAKNVRIYAAESGGGTEPTPDPENPTISLSPSKVSVIDTGGTEKIKVSLSAAPTGNVTVSISTGGVASVDKNTLTFTEDNYSTQQEVGVYHAGGALTSDASDTIKFSASGGGYDGVTASAAVTVTATQEPDPGEEDPAFSAMQTAEVSDLTMEGITGASIGSDGVFSGSSSYGYAAIFAPIVGDTSAIEWEAADDKGMWVMAGRNGSGQWAGFGDMSGGELAYYGNFNRGNTTASQGVIATTSAAFTIGTGNKYRALMKGTLVKVWQYSGSAWELKFEADLASNPSIQASNYTLHAIGLIFGSSYHKPKNIKVYKG